ncbi:MAG: protein kinase, partial [Myxococcales bacterium]|nr:protein kinase [Myxococcales bacterium]
KQLGAGGMGVVFAAYDPELDRKVAVKLIHTSAAESVEHRARMLREAQAMARLSHPNVLQVYEITEIDGEICVVMEYVDGQTLGEWAGGEPRGWRAVIECYLQFAAGLAAAHAEGIVHRDVKPDNAIIDRDGRVRVLDFGIAQTDAARGVDGVRVAAAGLDALAPLKTRTGALLGTPAYMSPEHVEGRGIDARSDQFSLCASLYEALYGRRPFRGDTLQQLIAAMLDEPLAPPPARTEVPSWVHDIVARGLSRDPKDRWPSLDALADALRDDPVARRRQRLWIGGGLALAAGAALAGWMAYTGGVEARAAEARAQESEAQARAVEERSAAALRESYLGSLGHGGYVELQTLDNPLRALVMLNEVYRDRPGDLHLRELLAVASRPADAHEWSAEAHASAVGAIAVSPDGALVASADKHALRVWDAAS